MWTVRWGLPVVVPALTACSRRRRRRSGRCRHSSCRAWHVLARLLLHFLTPPPPCASAPCRCRTAPPASPHPAAIARTLQTILGRATSQLSVSADGTPTFRLAASAAAPAADKVSVLNNLDWFGPMSFLGFLRDIGKHARVGQMLAKESVRSRDAGKESVTDAGQGVGARGAAAAHARQQRARTQPRWHGLGQRSKE